MPKRLQNIWASLEKKFRGQLSKVAQSGHTDCNAKSYFTLSLSLSLYLPTLVSQSVSLLLDKGTSRLGKKIDVPSLDVEHLLYHTSAKAKKRKTNRSLSSAKLDTHNQLTSSQFVSLRFVKSFISDLKTEQTF